MTKRILALLMTSIIMLTAVPLSPLAEYFSVEASAADLSELQKVYDSAPPKEEWHKYIDVTALEAYYTMAEMILAGEYDQNRIDTCTANLKKAIEGLKLHTLDIQFDKTVATVNVGATLQLNAILTPENAADEIFWQTSDSDIAEVTQKGLVTVKKYSPTGVTVIASSKKHS